MAAVQGACVRPLFVVRWSSYRPPLINDLVLSLYVSGVASTCVWCLVSLTPDIYHYTPNLIGMVILVNIISKSQAEPRAFLQLYDTIFKRVSIRTIFL